MIKVSAALTSLAIAMIPTPAAAANVWYSATTTEGCTIYWWTGDVYSEAAFRSYIRFSWSGRCPRGGVASGRGRLSQDIRAGNAGGTPPQHWEFDGTMVNGVLDGDVTVSFAQEGTLIWSGSLSHHKGCVAATCTPRQDLSQRRHGVQVPNVRNGPKADPHA